MLLSKMMEMVKGVSGASPMPLKMRASMPFKSKAMIPLKTKTFMPFIILFLFLLSTQDVVVATQPPNIVLIVIDDLGKTITDGPFLATLVALHFTPVSE